MTSVTSLLLNSTNSAPWGGLIVLPVVSNRLGYIVAIIIGSVVTALMVSILKKNVNKEIEPTIIQDDKDIDLDITF